MDSCGVIVGANERYAWLLPWWWRHYARHNAYPVTFIDFGLSEEVLAWCKERGKVIHLDASVVSVCSKDAVDPMLAREWEAQHGTHIWDARKCFFYKPVAFRQSPYPISLWLDLDCEVCGSLQPLFDVMNSDTEMALSAFPDRPGTYSSGAVVFRPESQLVKDWVELCQSHGAQVLEEDSILSWLVGMHKYAVQVLPPSYHSIGLPSLPASGLVLHWNGNLGKLFIEILGGYQDYKEALLRGSHG